MRELLDLLARPSGWSALHDLPAHQRAVAALAVLAITVVVAALAGVLSARWMRARTDDGRSAQNARMIERLRTGFVWLVACFGGYAAVEIAPLPPHIESFLSGLTFVIGAVLSGRLVIHLALLVVASSLAHMAVEERHRIERDYLPVLGKTLWLAVTLVVVIVVLKHFGQDVSSLVAALGVGSLAIGLAAQQTLGNMFAGFTLMLDRPFRAGDRVRLATGEVGDVVEIGVRSTRILLGERNLLIVPNTELANSRVVNFAYPTPAGRGEVRLTVAYGADTERLLTLLAEIAEGAKAGQPTARVAQLGPQGIELVVSFDVANPTDAANVEQEVRRRILRKFAEERLTLGVRPAAP